MTQPLGLELDVAFGQAALVKAPGVGHPKVGAILLASGLLIPNGFLSIDANTVVLIVPAGKSPTDAVIRLSTEVEKLVASGKIQIKA